MKPSLRTWLRKVEKVKDLLDASDLSEGGQAIVGNVGTGGDTQKPKEQAHAQITHAPEPEMRGSLSKEGRPSRNGAMKNGRCWMHGAKLLARPPSYVSPIQYQNYTCDQLQAEAQRISAHAMAAAGAQDKRRTNDAVATTVGVVLFWPSLFFIKGDNEKTAELARLKGEMDAIERASIQKNCGIIFQREPPPPPKRKSVYD